MANARHRERVLGALLGVAVGDCLGTPLAGLDEATIRRRHGIVSKYLAERPIWSSVTQQALTLVEATGRRGSADPSWVGRRWVEMALAREGLPKGTHRGAHPAFVETIAALRRGGDWRSCGHVECAGCANAVRIVPIATALAQETDDGLAAMITDDSLVTHRELRGISAGLAAGWVASRLRREPGYPIPAARGRALLEELAAWLRKREEILASEIAGVWVALPSHVHDVSITLGGLAARFDEGWPIERRWVERYASARLGRPAHSTEDCALCVVPTALAIVLGSERRFEETLIYAVNLGHDAGTLGALVGGLAGAAGGVSAIPTRLRHIEGRAPLTAWGDALACRTAPDTSAPCDCPGLEDLPDVPELEARLSLLAESNQPA